MSRVELQGAAGNRLIGDQYGDRGETVVLLHGGGQTRHSWVTVARRLADRGYNAIAIDLRGHGDSDWAEDGGYAFFDYADDVACIVKSVTEARRMKPILVGASLGGVASLLAEGAEPGSIAALVMVDVTPRMDPDGVAKIQGFMREKADAGFATIDEAADAVAAYLPHRRRPRSHEGLRKNLRLHADGRWRWHWDPRFLDGPRPISTLSADVERSLIAAARSLTCPTLLIRGGRSELVTEEHAREFLDLVPHARFTDISDAGHMVAGDSNDVFAEAVSSFLADLRA